MILAILAAGVLSASVVAADDSTARGTPSLLVVSSAPGGAEVFVDSLYVGMTPCTTRVSPDLAHLLLVLQSPAKAWLTDAVAETVLVAAGDTARRHILFRPAPFLGTPPDLPTSEALDVTGVNLRPRSHWGLYLSGGGAILGGAAAAYLKGRADAQHAEFLATRDPALAASRDRYDRTSTIFLVAAELSFGLFLAYLLSE